MKKLILLTIVVTLLLSLIGCAGEGIVQQPYPTSKLSGDEAKITPNTDTDIVKSEIEEVPKLDEPKIEENAMFSPLYSIEEVFSLSGYVVHGKIARTHEIVYKRTYGSGATSSEYATILDVSVIKSYGNKALEHKNNDVIQVSYINCSYSTYKGLAELKKGDECILFLCETSVVWDTATQDYFDYTPYIILMPDAFVIEKVEDGFNANALMQLSTQGDYKAEGENRAVKIYSLNEIEKVIMANIHKLRGLSFREFLIERAVSHS